MLKGLCSTGARHILNVENAISPVPTAEDAVRTEPGFATLFAEYNKYLLRRAAVWLDV